MKSRFLFSIFVASFFASSCSDDSSKSNKKNAEDTSVTEKSSNVIRIADKSEREIAAKKDQSSIIQTVYGPPVETHPLHNTDCVSCNNAPFEHGCFDNWCFKKMDLTVTVPKGWTFTGEPFVNCVKNDQGSFEWNNFRGAPDRFKIIQRSPNSIRAEVWAGSRKITINLACEATRN